MTTAYNVNVDANQIAGAKLLLEFVGGNSDDALRIAINKTVQRVKVTSSRTIRAQVRLQLSYVNERLKITKATRKSLSARIRAESRGLLLSRFSTDTTIASDKVGWWKPPAVPPRGIRVKIKPAAGSAKVVTGDNDTRGNKPFYMIVNGGNNVAIAARMRGSRKVKVFAGPSLSQVFGGVRNVVMLGAADVFTAEMLDAMRYLLTQRFAPEPPNG